MLTLHEEHPRARRRVTARYLDQLLRRPFGARHFFACRALLSRFYRLSFRLDGRTFDQAIRPLACTREFNDRPSFTSNFALRFVTVHPRALASLAHGLVSCLAGQQATYCGGSDRRRLKIRRVIRIAGDQ